MAPDQTFRALIPTASAYRITRRTLLAGLFLAGASTALTACSKTSAYASSVLPDGKLEGQLNVYSWGDYDDPANITAFQKNGTTVQLDSYGSNEEMIAKLGATRGTSGYDVVVPTGEYIPMMAANGLLQKLDHRYLPNLKNVDPQYLDQSWDRGNIYSVCKNWGTTGFAYDSTVITRPMRSWADFLEATQNEASKNVALLEDPWEVMSTFFASHGYDPNTEDPKLIDECEAFMVERIAPHIKAFNSSAAQSGIPQGTFALIQAFNGDARQGLLATSTIPKNWHFVFPTPTANLWMDTWAIAKGAQHMDSAYAFINHMLQPEVSMKEVDYIGYNTGVTGVREKAIAEDFALPDLVFPPADVVARLTPARLTSSAERLVAIVNKMMAKAGS